MRMLLQCIHKVQLDNTACAHPDEPLDGLTSHTNSYLQVDINSEGDCEVLIGKGQRFILVHAGDIEGWELVLISFLNLRPTVLTTIKI